MTCDFWTISGLVVHGFGRGRNLLGFPTANLELDEASLSCSSSISPGIYSGIVTLSNSTEWYPISLSVGNNPSFDDVKHSKIFEGYIHHHFEKDFYGSTLTVLITEYLAPQQPFSSLDELKAYITQMVKRTDTLVSTEGSQLYQLLKDKNGLRKE
ncbi:hypothetical protein P9112_003033 [Eukaryota sp. TZLM1-RC]